MKSLKKILPSICLFFLITNSLFTQSEIKATTANLNFRNTPSDTSLILLVIPKNTLLTIDLNNQEYVDWIKIKYNNKTGYVNKNFLKTPNSNNTEVKFYTNSQGQKTQSPTHYKSPPQGATAECNDGTYSFSQSRRGTCSHHGGVKKWL